jgi:hypothetical protein
MRLEGWQQGTDSRPSFETPRKSAAPQDEVPGIRTDWFHGIDRPRQIVTGNTDKEETGNRGVDEKPPRVAPGRAHLGCLEIHGYFLFATPQAALSRCNFS